MAEIIYKLRGSKDIAEAMDAAKRELIDLYRHHRYLTDVDAAISMDPSGIPRIEVTYETLVEV